MKCNVKLIKTIKLVSMGSFKKYKKDITIPIQPYPGLLIDNETIEAVSIDTDLNMIICHVFSVDAQGEKMFDVYCDSHEANGWIRI